MRRIEWSEDFSFADGTLVKTPQELASAMDRSSQHVEDVWLRLCNGELEKWLRAISYEELADDVSQLSKKPQDKDKVVQRLHKMVQSATSQRKVQQEIPPVTTQTAPQTTPFAATQPMPVIPQEQPQPPGFLARMTQWIFDRVAPNPDEGQRVLPWPSWKWQRLALLVGGPLAVLITLASGQIGLVITGAALLAIVVYAGIKTHWLRATKAAPQPARVVTGVAVAGSGIVLVVGAAGVVLAIAMIILVVIGIFIVASVFFRNQ